MSAFTGSLLPFFGVVRVSGNDCAAFLHSQLSNDINHLPVGSACYATYNTPKGRVLANMLVLKHDGDILLIMARDLTDTVIRRLRLYVLRSKVVFEVADKLGVAGLLCTPAQNPGLPDAPSLVLATKQQQHQWLITLPHGGVLMVGPADELPPYHQPAAVQWQNHEIRCGYAWINAASSERCVAQMLNQHLIGGVHFKKGCYPGQEIIARAQYRGQVKRGLALLSSTACAQDGDKILNEKEEEVGLLINQAAQDEGCLALAVIKFSAAEQTLHLADSRMRLTLENQLW